MQSRNPTKRLGRFVRGMVAESLVKKAGPEAKKSPTQLRLVTPDIQSWVE
jgi:hypothetical protein